MDSRAQASSVFQLLISAVVALAVLMILLSVLNVIDFGVSQDPAKAASDLIRDAWNNPAQVKSVKKVTFNSTAKSINAISLAGSSKVGISDSEICLSAGSFSDKTEIFEVSDNKKLLEFQGTGSRDVGMAVFCYAKGQLADTIDDVGGSAFSADWASGCCDEASEEETCCIVALRIAS